MQKNTSGQKFVVFAFNRTTNVPLTGDAANITANLQKDFGTSTATNDVNPTELEDGYYAFDATQAETNADALVIYPASVTSDIQVIGAPAVLYTVSTGSPDEVVQSANHTSGIAAISLVVPDVAGTANTVTPLDAAGIRTAVGLASANMDTQFTASATATGFNTVVPPSVSQFNARTILSADYFDPAADAVANVTLVATTTTNTDMINQSGIGVIQQNITRAKDATSQIIPITIQDSSSSVGGKLAGLVFNSASLVAYYNRIGSAGAATQITLVTATKGTYTSSGFVAIDNTNMTGDYELHVPNAVLATGAEGVWIKLSGAANMVPVEIYIDLVSEIELDSSGRVDVGKMNSATLLGVGTSGDKWRG